MINELLREQVAYYDARAAEYDDAYKRRGLHDHGPDDNRQWNAELAVVEDALRAFDACGDVLEVACGSGYWTRLLATTATRLTALDASAAMLAEARRKILDHVVEFREHTVLSVGVHCDVTVLDAREAARGDRWSGEGRSHPSDGIHSWSRYDLDVDTSSGDTAAVVAAIIRASREHRGPTVFELARGTGGRWPDR